MLIDVHKACLLVFNLQREFVPSLQKGQVLVDSCCWLSDLATHFDVPVLILNHKALGQPLGSVTRIAPQAESVEVGHFSCTESEGVQNFLKASGRLQFLLSGAETHISILQSAFSLPSGSCFVVEDACSSRSLKDHDRACARLKAEGVSIVSKEMVFFEFLRHSLNPDYMELSLRFLDGRYLRE